MDGKEGDSTLIGGILLVAMMVIAMAVVNSPLGPVYGSVLETKLAGLTVLHWINDGLMAVFFLIVALEIKREINEGELSSRAQILLPAVAALGGMAVPALVYLAFNTGNPEAVRGWAIPSATDIAFSLGVLAVLGRRVPLSLRIFLTALAIIDDLGAILIIAVFYTGQLSATYLLAAGGAVLALAALNRLGSRHVSAYLAVGLVLWFCVLNSGVHATIAGVILGLAIPMSMVHRVEHGLAPWVTFLILPIFALANSGLSMAGMGAEALTDTVFLGVLFGLFIGKQVGVFGFTWLLIRAGFAVLPSGATWRGLYGVSVLTGIGFTMSLFIGGLAFPDGDAMAETRLGVLAGSVLSALLGYAVLASTPSVNRSTSDG